MASIGRLIKRTVEGKQSILDLLDKQILVRKPYDFSHVIKMAEKFHDYSKEEDIDGDEFRKRFFALFSAVFAEPPRSRKKIHPSSLMDDCVRQMYYEFTDVEYSDPVTRKIDARLQRIFDTGTWWHIYIQVMLWEAGLLEQAEAPVKSRKKRLDGRADGILKHNGKRMLLEIKTIGSFQFPKVKFTPFDKHEYQASLYASELGIDEIVYMYINKDTSEIQIHVKPPNGKFVTMANEKIEELNEDIKNRTVPTRVCKDVNSAKAKDCPFKSHCFKSKK